MLSTQLLDFEAREAREQKVKKINSKREFGTEMLPIDPQNTTVTKFSRLQRYQNLVIVECNNAEADTNEKKIAVKENFIKHFNALQNEHHHLLMTKPNLLTSCKRELFQLVETLLTIFKSSSTRFVDYIFIFDVVRYSDVLKSHTTNLNNFWSMPFTQTQIDSLNHIRDLAFATLKFSIDLENDVGYRSKDKRIISSLEKALQMDLFVLPLGNHLIQTSCESELKELLLEQQKKHGMHTPVSIMSGI